MNIHTTTIHKIICNLTPEDRNILKILWWKSGVIALGAISSLFHNILLPVFRFHVKTKTNFSFRNKHLLETREIEITKVDCTFSK